MSKSTGEELRLVINDADDARLPELLPQYAEWLEEQEDPLATGYRWLTEENRFPVLRTVETYDYGTVTTLLWGHPEHPPHEGKTNHHLPHAVFQHTILNRYAWGYGFRVSAFDDAASAYVQALTHGEIIAKDK